MPIRVTPDQIPALWEHIKYAAVSASGVEKEHVSMFLTRLLHMLLSEKAQCYVRLDDERRLVRIAITKVRVDEVTGENTLELSCLYGFQSTSMKEWEEDLRIFTEQAKKYKYNKILLYSNNIKAFELAESFGFRQHFRCYIKEV